MSSSIHSTAAAPSEICDDVPAVWMPPSITGLSDCEALERGVAQALVAGDEGALRRRLLLLVEDRRLDG